MIKSAKKSGFFLIKGLLNLKICDSLAYVELLQGSHSAT